MYIVAVVMEWPIAYMLSNQCHVKCLNKKRPHIKINNTRETTINITVKLCRLACSLKDQSAVSSLIFSFALSYSYDRGSTIDVWTQPWKMQRKQVFITLWCPKNVYKPYNLINAIWIVPLNIHLYTLRLVKYNS